MRLEQLNTASFKGVQFPCNSTRTSAGRAKIKHEFANSDKNNIEDQGLIPRIHQLTAIITGDNYRQTRDRLLAAIESPGPGVLIHPFYGRIENAEALPVSFDENVRTLGRIEIPITFEVSDSAGVPAVTANSPAGVTKRKDNLLNSLSLNVAGGFKVTNSFTGNFKAAQDKITEFIDEVSDNAVTTSISPDLASNFRAKVDTFRRNINNLIQDPSNLGESMTEIMNDISGLYETSEQTFEVISRFFDFGNADVIINETTVGLTERANNNSVLNSTVKASALAIGYESASLTDFRTIPEINTVSRKLEAVYRELKG
jgi:prophage DNA circulation protein